MRKGIILAGGMGKRLFPLTKVVSKHLLPIYDKPMIYYPINLLIDLGIKEILLICNQRDIILYKKTIKEMNLKKKIRFFFKVQKKPNGLPEAFKIGEKFLNKKASILALGDNIFYYNDLKKDINKYLIDENFASIFIKKINNSKDFGVIKKNKNKISILEKPKNNISKNVITGLYLFPQNVVDKAKKLKPSKRGETEITDLIKIYLKEKKLNICNLKKTLWFDTGTPDRILNASNKIRLLKKVN